MPEMPEVETIVRDLQDLDVEGREIIDLDIQRNKNIHNVSAETFRQELIGNQISRLDRRGKYIIFKLADDQEIVLHLRMTGKLFYSENGRKMGKHDLVRFELTGGLQLYYNDVRRFGRFYLVDDSEEIVDKLGPEPLEDNFKLEEFQNGLKNRSRIIKSLLLDQSFVAGLGNIYVDEALWEAGIHPETKSDQIPVTKQKALYNAIKNVLKKGIDNRGTSLGDGVGNYATVDRERGTNQNFLNIYQKEGQKCKHCGTEIEKIKVAQRGTHFCPDCQG